MDNHRLQIGVSCYAGYRAEETPQRLTFGERSIGVREVQDRWLDPGHRYFKLQGDDDGIYLVRHDTINDIWELVMFDSGGLPNTGSHIRCDD